MRQFQHTTIELSSGYYIYLKGLSGSFLSKRHLQSSLLADTALNEEPNAWGSVLDSIRYYYYGAYRAL